MRNNFPSKVREQYSHLHCCQFCGRGDLPLEAHHISGRLGKDKARKENCIILCKDCHETKIHLKEELLKITKEFYDKKIY
ncbi:MAG: HNH endonuclease [Bacilli bacterium]|jgi:5-methylcytosine-specific restriction endonuclease McrA